MFNPVEDDAGVSRAGWAALMRLLQAKGLITEAEVQNVVLEAYQVASDRKRALAALSDQPPSGATK